jgi:long-subunit acyl-CoA synthetase (AMP-forming)
MKLFRNLVRSPLLRLRDSRAGSRLISVVQFKSFSSFTPPSSSSSIAEHIKTSVDFKFETLIDMFEKTCEYHANNHVFGTRYDVGEFEWMTYAEFYDVVAKTRSALYRLGIRPNDKVALISNNRWEWAAISYATMGLGAQIVPMYEQQSSEDWKFIIEDSEAKIIIASTEQIHKFLKPLVGKIGKVQNLLCLDAPIEKTHSFKQ